MFQQTRNYSKSTIEALDKGLAYVQKHEKRHQNDVLDVFIVILVSLLLTINIFQKVV